MNAANAIDPSSPRHKGDPVPAAKPTSKRPKPKKSSKTALVISSLSRGPTLLDLPHEVLHDIHTRAANPRLVETCKSLAHSLLPSLNVSVSLRARYLLKRRFFVRYTNIPPRRYAAYCLDEEAASQALALALKTGLLDKQLVQFLDLYAAKPKPKPNAKKPFRAHLRVGQEKWLSMPRWFAQRMLGSDSAQVDATVDLMRDMFTRDMYMDKGYTVLKMVQQGKLDVLRKLKKIGMPLGIKDGLAVEVAVKEGHMDVALYLLSEVEVQPGPGAFESAIERVCLCARPQQAEPEAVGHHSAKTNGGKRAAAAEPSSTTNKRARKTLADSSASSTPPTPPQPLAAPSSIVLDDFCTLLLTHKAPISDKSLAIAIMAFPALSTDIIRQILDGMRRSNAKPSTLAFEAATHNPEAEKELIPLLIEYGGVPEFDQVQGVMERLFSV